MNALADDLNVANALSVVDKEIKEINSLTMKKDVDMLRLASLFITIKKLFDILGLKFILPEILPEDIALAQEYEKARTEKDFARSDELRPLLMKKGLL